jgi:hypothetical protein
MNANAICGPIDFGFVPDAMRGDLFTPKCPHFLPNERYIFNIQDLVYCLLDTILSTLSGCLCYVRQYGSYLLQYNSLSLRRQSNNLQVHNNHLVTRQNQPLLLLSSLITILNSDPEKRSKPKRVIFSLEQQLICNSIPTLRCFSHSKSTMNANSPLLYRPARRWEHETAMLASSMMLVSISEDRTEEDLGYKSRLCASNNSSRNGSMSGLSGWGTTTTRASCKMDLCSLAPTEPSKTHHQSSFQQQPKVTDEEEWGIVF